MHSLYKVNKWRNFMAKAELGNKQLCASCGTKFYDLKKEVPKCPKCGAEIIFKIKPRLGRPPLNKKPLVETPKVKVENQDTALEDEEELDSDLENLVSIEDLDEDLIAEEGSINIEDDEDSENLSGIADLDVHDKSEESDT